MKINFSSIIRHIISFSLATFIVCFILFWMFFFLGSPFTSKEKEFLKKGEFEKELIRKISISVVEAGYLRKKIGNEIFYIPTLLIDVYNLSENEFEKLIVISEFSVDNKVVCRGFAPLKTLKPGQTKRLLLKCIDFLGFGTIVKGMSFSQLWKEVHYEVTLRTEFNAVALLKGRLKFKPLTSIDLFKF